MGSRRALAAVLALGLFGAGCGGADLGPRASVARPPDGPAPPARRSGPEAVLRRSVSRTAAARTARTSVSVTITGLADDALAAGALDIAGTGAVDLRTGDARLALSLPRFDRIGGGGPIEQRIVAGVVYTRIPSGIGRARRLPDSVRWLSLDPRRLRGDDPSTLSQSQANPAGQLALVAAVAGDVHRVGSEPVRGVPATHFEATVALDPRASAARRMTAAAGSLAPLGALTGDRRLALDVWLDRAGRIRRVVVSVPLPSGSGSAGAGLGPKASMLLQADFYAFGAPVRVAAPPSAQVRPYAGPGLPGAHR